MYHVKASNLREFGSPGQEKITHLFKHNTSVTWLPEEGILFVVHPRLNLKTGVFTERGHYKAKHQCNKYKHSWKHNLKEKMKQRGVYFHFLLNIGSNMKTISYPTFVEFLVPDCAVTYSSRVWLRKFHFIHCSCFQLWTLRIKEKLYWEIHV